jgi:cytochrome oxidase Cu insertion factor (SCO1/SenC/PrrC family)
MTINSIRRIGRRYAAISILSVAGMALVLGPTRTHAQAGNSAAANPQPKSIEVGQPAPDFTLPDQDGKMHRLADYRGKTVILAFYPKDFTGG